MAERLSEKIKEAVRLYYIHRERQSVETWDKGEDLKRIFTAAREQGWCCEACAGTFWFSKKVLLGTHVIKVTERTLATGGESNIADDGKPFGAMHDIAEALRKVGKEPFFIRNEKDVNAYADLVNGNCGGGKDGD